MRYLGIELMTEYLAIDHERAAEIVKQMEEISKRAQAKEDIDADHLFLDFFQIANDSFEEVLISFCIGHEWGIAMSTV